MNNHHSSGESVRVESLELEGFADDSEENGKDILSGDRYINVVKDVEIKLSAFLGTAELTVGQLFALKTGGVLKLDRASTEPVELKLRGQLVARGNLVVVEDNFGIQITEVCEL